MATINCPHCNNQLNVPDNLNGMQVSCPICNQTFTAGQSAAASAPVFDTPADSGRFSVGNCNQLPLILGGLALLLAVIALVMQLMAPSVPYLKFKKDPEDAVKAYVKYNISRAQQSSYFWREHGGEIIDSLKISEVKTSGNFAAVFYTLSRGATTVKRSPFTSATPMVIISAFPAANFPKSGTTPFPVRSTNLQKTAAPGLTLKNNLSA